MPFFKMRHLFIEELLGSVHGSDDGMPWFVSCERLDWIITDFLSGLTFPLVNVRNLPAPESQVLYLYIHRMS